MSKMTAISMLALVAVAMGCAGARASDLSCKGLSIQIDDLMKEKSLEEAKEIQTTSNNKAQLSAIRQDMLATEINTLVNMMIYKQCPIDNIHIVGSPYASQAMKCARAWKSDSPDCDRSGWVPETVARN